MLKAHDRLETISCKKLISMNKEISSNQVEIRKLIMDALTNCKLQIGAYPMFHYDATGGGGTGNIIIGKLKPMIEINFDPEFLKIPSLCSTTTRFLGLPLPPGLIIKIKPQRLDGQISKSDLNANLEFEANFSFSILGLIKAPNLKIYTTLTTKKIISNRHRFEGRSIDKNGFATLVGVAMVNKTGVWWFDRFLGLPDEALAVLNCKFTPVFN